MDDVIEETSAVETHHMQKSMTQALTQYDAEILHLKTLHCDCVYEESVLKRIFVEGKCESSSRSKRVRDITWAENGCAPGRIYKTGNLLTYIKKLVYISKKSLIEYQADPQLGC